MSAGAFNNCRALLSQRGNPTGARDVFQQALLLCCFHMRTSVGVTA